MPRQRKSVPSVDPKLLIKDAGKLLPEPSRRLFLRGAASLGALVLVLQAGVIATVLIANPPGSFRTASLSMNEPITRDLAAAAPRHAQVRFSQDARVGDITALLDKYQASIVDGAKGGLFRLQFANTSMSKDEFSNLMSRLQGEKIISLAVPTP